MTFTLISDISHGHFPRKIGLVINLQEILEFQGVGSKSETGNDNLKFTSIFHNLYVSLNS